MIGIAGHGLHKDRTWSRQYEELKGTELQLAIPWEPAAWRALQDSFLEWIHEAGSFEVVPDVPHDFWSTHPDTWLAVVAAACADVVRG